MDDEKMFWVFFLCFVLPAILLNLFKIVVDILILIGD